MAGFVGDGAGRYEYAVPAIQVQVYSQLCVDWHIGYVYQLQD